MARALQFGKTSPSRVKRLAIELGQRLRLARKRRRLTQAELADKAGIHRLTVRKVEMGEIQTAIGAYLAIAWALGIDQQVGQLFLADPEGEALERSRLPQRVRATLDRRDEF
jgi:transcriptional regulator with XRE-family HTH domain